MAPDPNNDRFFRIMNSNITTFDSFPIHSYLHDFTVKSIDSVNGGDSRDGPVVIHYSGQYSGYKMKVNMRNGKKEGNAVILRDNGTVFMKLQFANDLANGEVIRKSEYGRIVLRGELKDGVEFGIFKEFNESQEVIWMGFYQDGRRYSSVSERKEMKGFYNEYSTTGELLSVSQYDKDLRLKHGHCYEFVMGFIKNECVYEKGMKKRVIREFVAGGLMRLFDDNGKKVYEGVWFGDMVNGFVIHPEMERMDGFFKEVNMNGDLLSVSEYDESGLLKNGKCFEYEGGRLVRECEYKNGVMMRVLREWKGECMIEYDVNGMRVYEGGFEGDMMKGFVREGEGKEYGIDGKSALYVGGWKNGLREGYGSEFKGYSALYVGEWKNGMRDGKGKELNENEEVIRSGKWIKGEYEGATKRFEDGYGNDLSGFDVDCLKGIGRLKIGNDCFKKVNRFVIDGLNELKSVNIGWNSFKLNKENRCGSKCLIMNCDQLSEIHIGGWSFFWYESFELKNLRSLISIQLDQYAFMKCHSIVFESMND